MHGFLAPNTLWDIGPPQKKRRDPHFYPHENQIWVDHVIGNAYISALNGDGDLKFSLYFICK